MPSPIAAATHIDDTLPPPIPFDAAIAGEPVDLQPAPAAATLSSISAAVAGVEDSSGRISEVLRAIRPICIGALMAIPTAGAASVGFVAMVSRSSAMAMVDASTGFLAGIPTDIVLLIGTLATGYGAARTVEKLSAWKAAA